MHYDYASMWPLRGEGHRFVATLAPEDTAEVPGTTKRYFSGPGWVMYQMYPDGGMEVIDSRQVTVVYGKLP